MLSTILTKGVKAIAIHLLSKHVVHKPGFLKVYFVSDLFLN